MATYRLPFENVPGWLVSKGNFDDPGGNRHDAGQAGAWDITFGVDPLHPNGINGGAKVLAARSGIVVGRRADATVVLPDGIHDDQTKPANNAYYALWGPGNYLVIQHVDGSTGHYNHLDVNSIRVQLGEYVTQGTWLANVGHYGNTSGGVTHLHFEVRSFEAITAAVSTNYPGAPLLIHFEDQHHPAFRPLDGDSTVLGTMAPMATVLRQDGWRCCGNCQGLYYAFGGPGVPSVCPATAGPHRPGSDGNYVLSGQAGPGRQSGWQFCNKCGGMFYGGNPHSKCPVHSPTTEHVNGGGVYAIANNSPSDPGQHHWRWCSKCQGLWYAGNPGSACPGDPGQPHSAVGSGDYAIEVNPADFQRNWRWCMRCQGLFYAGNGPGVCQAGPGGHVLARSASYVLQCAISPLNPSGPQPASWTSAGRYCANCGLLWLGTAQNSRCPAKPGGPHVSAGSGVYFLRATTKPPSAAGQTGWGWCGKCHCLWAATNAGSKCAADGLDHSVTNVIDPRDYTVANDTDAWRRCVKCQSLFCWTTAVGAFGGVCAVDKKPHDDAGSASYAVALNTSPWPGAQKDWQRCSKCATLWFSQNASKSVCPADHGLHDSKVSASYFLIQTGHGALGETGWRRCSKCQAAWSGHTGSVCPADNAAHSSAGSSDYTLAGYT